MRKDFRNLRPFLSCCLGYGFLCIATFVASGHLVHISMVWNLLLAVLPLVFSTFLGHRNGWQRVVVAVLWLLFLPNAFYVLTDFIHVSNIEFFTGGYYDFEDVTYNYNLVVYLELMNIAIGYVLALVAGVWSVHGVQKMIPKKWRVVALSAVFVLTGYAIYIGRFLRLNSWNVLSPGLMIEKIWSGMTWFGLGATLLFAGYVAAVYGIYLVVFSTKKISK